MNHFFKTLLFLSVTSSALFAGNKIQAPKIKQQADEKKEEGTDSRATTQVVDTQKLIVRGDAVIKRALTNEINPVKITPKTATRPESISVDECGLTAFSGNVGLRPNKKLLVNEINPVKRDNKTGELVANDNGVTCFSGNAAVTPAKDLLVNNISPVKTVPQFVGQTDQAAIDPCTKEHLTRCVADNACGAATKFSGDLWIKNKHVFGQVDNVTVTQNNCSKGLNFNFGSYDAIKNPCIQGAYVKLTFIGQATAAITRADSYPECIDLILCADAYIHPSCGVLAGPMKNYGQSCLAYDYDNDVVVTANLCSSWLEESNSKDVPVGMTFSVTYSQESEIDLTVPYIATGQLYYEIISHDNMVASCIANPCLLVG